MADKYSNDFVPVQPRTLKIRGFLGIDQSGDENDLDPKYSANARNVDYSKASIKRALGVEVSEYADSTFGTPYVLKVFSKVEASGARRNWLVAVSQESGVNVAGVWVRYIADEYPPTYPQTWQKIHDITAQVDQPGFSSSHKGWNFKNYQDGAVGELIFTTNGKDLYKWPGTYTDGVADQATKLYYVDETNHAPRGKLIAIYKERVFVAGVATSPDTLYWSNELEPDDWTEDEANPNDAGHLDVPTWDGDTISAIVALNDDLLIFKRYSLFRLGGSSPADFTLTKIADIGTPTALTVTVAGDKAYFFSRRGVMAFDGVNLSQIIPPNRIEAVKFLASDSNYHTMGAAARLFSHNNKLLLVLGFSGWLADDDPIEKPAPQVVEYDLDTNAVSFRKDQLCKVMDPGAPNEHEYSLIDFYWYFASLSALRYQDLLLGVGLGTIFVYDSGDNTLREHTWEYGKPLDNIGKIHMFHAIPASDFSVAGKRKRVSKITVSGKGGTVKITPICDNVAKRAITLELPTSYSVLKPKVVSWFGRKIGFWVENVDGDPIEVTDIEPEYTVQGV